MEQFDEKIIAVGYLFEPEIHDRYELEGEFIEVPEYGLQFKFKTSNIITGGPGTGESSITNIISQKRTVLQPKRNFSKVRIEEDIAQVKGQRISRLRPNCLYITLY